MRHKTKMMLSFTGHISFQWMACRRTGRKPLFEPMMMHFTDAYRRHMAETCTNTSLPCHGRNYIVTKTIRIWQPWSITLKLTDGFIFSMSIGLEKLWHRNWYTIQMMYRLQVISSMVLDSKSCLWYAWWIGTFSLLQVILVAIWYIGGNQHPLQKYMISADLFLPY